MKQIIHKSNLRRDRMPEWLLWILVVTLEAIKDVSGSYRDFLAVKGAIDTDLKQLKVKASVITEIVNSEEETVLFIKRSGRILVSIYIK